MSNVNWLGCLVACLAVFASGFAWFNGKTFFPVWWRLMDRGDAAIGGLIVGVDDLATDQIAEEELIRRERSAARGADGDPRPP